MLTAIVLKLPACGQRYVYEMPVISFCREVPVSRREGL